MDDSDIVARIGRIVDEEHRLERRDSDEPLTDEDRAALAELEVQLDQCWDLLRQRRARRQAGQDPDQAAVRPADIVEHYRQ